MRSQIKDSLIARGRRRLYLSPTYNDNRLRWLRESIAAAPACRMKGGSHARRSESDVRIWFLVVKRIQRAYIKPSTFGRTVVAVSPSLIARRTFRPFQNIDEQSSRLAIARLE
jgi:hypothetical protein